MGNSVVLTCSLIRGKDVSFSWIKDGILIERNQRVDVESVRKSSTLSIERVEARDAGTYTCIAANAAAEARTSTTLIINGTVGSVVFMLDIVTSVVIFHFFVTLYYMVVSKII